jgi:hypothetical protein
MIISGVFFEKTFRNLFVEDSNGREVIVESGGRVKVGRYVSGRMIFEVIETQRYGSSCKIVDVQSGSDPSFKIGRVYYFYNSEIQRLIKGKINEQ